MVPMLERMFVAMIGIRSVDTALEMNHLTIAYSPRDTIHLLEEAGHELVVDGILDEQSCA
jgi:hypothetical protein